MLSSFMFIIIVYHFGPPRTILLMWRIIYCSLNIHCEKSLFVLAFHQKISLPRIENPAADTRKFFSPPIDLIYIPHG
jgi:hypothetical protein